MMSVSMLLTRYMLAERSSVQWEFIYYLLIMFLYVHGAAIKTLYFCFIISAHAVTKQYNIQCNQVQTP